MNGSGTCVQSVRDQASVGCLDASSIATFGLLFPYPGLNNTFGALAVAAGGQNNVASGTGSFVGGGYSNIASDLVATVGGGGTNTASGASATVGGGYGNIASGNIATVSGGYNNSASVETATVGGGNSNTASGENATVGGGAGNSASGNNAASPGGALNTAEGNYSFAAGRQAKANHTGAFVWGDSFFGNKTSSAADEFNVYASGGARIFSNTAATTGVLLAGGGGTWTSVSDRDAKENIETVDGRDVLERLASVPIATWNYKTQDDSIRHMGPMAQDFYAAFGLGLGDKTIDTIDPDGVALAAIQGLNEKLVEKDAEIAELRAELDALKAALEPLMK